MIVNEHGEITHLITGVVDQGGGGQHDHSWTLVQPVRTSLAPTPSPSPPSPPSPPPSPPSPPPPPSPGPSVCGTCKVCFNPTSHKCQTDGAHRPKTQAACEGKGHIWCGQFTQEEYV
jgi:hypothetical protein